MNTDPAPIKVAPQSLGDAVEELHRITAIPGMPDSAWQQFNVGAMRRLLTAIAFDEAGGIPTELHDAVKEKDKELRYARKIVEDIRIIMEPGVTGLAERSGKIRAALNGYASGPAEKMFSADDVKTLLLDISSSVQSMDYEPPESSLHTNELKRKLIEAGESVSPNLGATIGTMMGVK